MPKSKTKSRRKTYTTKAAAKKSKKKGQSLYKAKGGYRLTKPRKTKKTKTKKRKR